MKKNYSYSFLLLFIIAIILGILLITLLVLDDSKLDSLNYNAINLSHKATQYYLQQTFPEANEFKVLNSSDFSIFRAICNNETIGFAKIIYKNIQCSVCTDVCFVCGVDTSGKIVRIVLINNFDLNEYEKKIASIEHYVNKWSKKSFGKEIGFNVTLVSDFVRQFYGLTFKNLPLYRPNQLNIISGATKSSYLFYEGVKEFLIEIKKII